MANASYPRAERVRHAIREVIAGEIENMADPGLGMVTITEVTLSPDMRHAKAYYTVYGSDVTAASTKDALKRAAGHMRSIVAKEVRLRYTPTLEFRADPLPDHASHIESLIDRMNRPEPAAEASEEADAPSEA